MNKKIKLLIGLVSITIMATSCKNDCEPILALTPVDEVIYLNILNPNGTSYIKYPGNAIPDSVKVQNLTTGAFVPRGMLSDSLLLINEFTKTNNTTTAYKITKGNLLKPDTLTLTISRKVEQDNCQRDFDVARFSTVKTNTVTRCNGNCVTNVSYVLQR